MFYKLKFICYTENTEYGSDFLRRTRRTGSFLLTLLINMLLNPEGLIPFVILLVLHFWLDISIWWAVIAFAIWILYLVIWMLVFRWIHKCSTTPDKPKENKNPYSAGKYKP